MNLAQRCFFWVTGVAILAVIVALLFAGIELGRINRAARDDQIRILMSEMLLTLDRHAVNSDRLALIAKRDFPKLPPSTSVALVNGEGEIVVSSELGREGSQAPEEWMAPDHHFRADRWAHWFRGTLTMGGAVMDPQGKQVATLVAEHTVPSVPVIATILLAALRWGSLVLAAFLPACWFASRLITRPLSDAAADGIAMLDTIRHGGADPGEDRVPVMAPELARFGQAVIAVEAQFAQAIEAVSGSTMAGESST
jgi:hypothetical protein